MADLLPGYGTGGPVFVAVNAGVQPPQPGGLLFSQPPWPYDPDDPNRFKPPPGWPWTDPPTAPPTNPVSPEVPLSRRIADKLKGLADRDSQQAVVPRNVSGQTSAEKLRIVQDPNVAAAIDHAVQAAGGGGGPAKALTALYACSYDVVMYLTALFDWAGEMVAEFTGAEVAAAAPEDKVEVNRLGLSVQQALKLMLKNINEYVQLNYPKRK